MSGNVTIIPDPNASYLMNFFTSRDNNADPSTFVGQQARMWWNPQDNSIYVSDGVTPGGIPVSGGGGGGGVTRIVAGTNINISPAGGTGVVTINSTGGGGNAEPAGPVGSIQFNDGGVFGGDIALTFDKNTGTLTSNALNFTNALYIGGTLFTRTLTVGRATTPVTVPLASNNSFNVLAADGQEITVLTT